MDLSFLSKTPGIGGTIKNEPEDFLVEEISEDGIVLEFDKQIVHSDTPGRFVYFILQKKNWSTSYAIKEIANSLHSSPKRFNYAGMKDKAAITTQIVSMEGGNKEALISLKIKDISINGAWMAKQRVSLGELAGNRFTIKVNGASEDAEEKVQKIQEELDKKFPNYFGEQRFGSVSKNTHIVGERIVRGDFENAAISFLCEHSDEEKNQEAKIARKELLESRDFNSAIRSFPKHLKFERTIIDHLARKEGDYIGAFRTLPRQMLLLFVHAFQSHIFNQLLSERIREGKGNISMEEGEYLCPTNAHGFPDVEKMDVEGFLCMKILGYNSNPNDREKELLEKLNIKKEDFKIPKIPEIGSKGTFRTAFSPLVGFSFDSSLNTFRFSLQSGSYATTALREFIEKSKD